MVRQDLVEFGFNDLFNVVAYSVMSAGKQNSNDMLRFITPRGDP